MLATAARPRPDVRARAIILVAGLLALAGSVSVAFVTDTGNNRVQKFTSAGSFLLQWGSFGSANGRFSGPMGVATDGSGNVYVCDAYHNRLEKFPATEPFWRAGDPTDRARASSITTNALRST